MKMKKNKKPREIPDYDNTDTTSFLDLNSPLRFEDLELKLPIQPPTQVISIRLPSQLINELRAFGSQRDIPYQALIKLFLAEKLAEKMEEVKK